LSSFTFALELDVNITPKYLIDYLLTIENMRSNEQLIVIWH